MVVVVVAKIAWWWLWIPRNPLALLVAPSWPGCSGGCKNCLVEFTAIALLLAPSWHGLGGGCKICLVVVEDSAESISTASST